MIPSRPLQFGDLFTQTFSLFGKTFPRYALFFVLFFVPGAIVLTNGSIGLMETVVHVSQHHTGFNDHDLLLLRNRVRDEIYKNNPGLRQETQEQSTVDSIKATHTDSVRWLAADSSLRHLPMHRDWHLTYIISNFAPEFVSEIFLCILGGLLLLIGFSGLNAATTDLACQAFEERNMKLSTTLGDTAKRHMWRILLLLVIWVLGSLALSIVREVFAGIANSIGNFFLLLITVGEMFLFVRLSLTIPAMVSEDMGPVQGLARSWLLTAGSWWRVFGLMVGFGILLIGVSIVIFVVSALFVAGSAFLWWRDFLQMPAVTISYFMGGMSSFVRSMVLFFSVPLFILFPFTSIFSTLLYYDLRTRNEGPLMYSDQADPANPGAPMWQP